MEINNINKALTIENDDRKAKTDNMKSSFSDILKDTLKEVNELQIQSGEAKKKMALGEVDNLHDVSIIGEKADVALQVTMAIRGKILEAYKEILRMQI